MPVEPPVVSPATLAEAYALAGRRRPTDRWPAGPTSSSRSAAEIGEPPERVLDLWRLDELRGIAVRDGALELGALTTYTDIRRSALCAEHAPALVEAAATIGAAQIQNRGTLGGNAMNASPAGDTLPVLLALDAELVAGGTRGERTIPASAFWPAYRRTAVRPDELLVRVRIPVVADREQRFRKVGTRRAQAISKVVIALGLARRARTPAPGGTSASRSARSRRPRSGPPRPRRRSRARHPIRRPPTAPSRPSPPSSSRSTTSARPPPTAARSPAGSSDGSSATPAAGSFVRTEEGP